MVLPDHPDKIQAADMRQLDVSDHQIRLELPSRIERIAAVRHRFRLMAMRREKVAEQLDVEGIVLDDQDLGQFASFELLLNCLKRCSAQQTMTR